MTKTIYIFLLFLLNSNLIKSQTKNNSVLASGNWYKFSVDRTGVFKIDKDFLQKLGINTTNLNPKYIKIYGNGGGMLPQKNNAFRYSNLQQNAIYIKGEDDQVFDQDDFILFYAKGPHQWNIDLAGKIAHHKQNIYDDKAYYFITIGNSPGKRIAKLPEITTNTNHKITTFDDFTFYEKEQRNLFAIGREWFGEDFSVQNRQTFQIPFENFLPNGQMSIKVRAVAISYLTSYMNVSINNNTNFVLNLDATRNGLEGNIAQKQTQFKNSSPSIDVTIDYNNNGNPAAKAYLDYIEIVGKKKLIALGNSFSFRSFDAAKMKGTLEYQIENADKISQVWEVTDPINPKEVTPTNATNTFNFKADAHGLRQYCVVAKDDFGTPELTANSNIPNQNLHNYKDINYLIITNRKLQSQAERLATYYNKNTDITTKVVLIDQIYNEFSSGAKDITAIRDFLKHLYQNNSSSKTKLKYACFFGDSSYDYKNRIAENTDIIPAFESQESMDPPNSYVTDDYYAMFDPDEGLMRTDDKMDITTGRIPVNNLEQATDVVDKLLSYYNQNAFGDWRNNITVIADDIDGTGEEIMQQSVEEIAKSIKKNKPVFNINKIYTDAYKQENSSGGERYPSVNTSILNSFEKGTLLMDYFGHGGEDGLAGERILGFPDIGNMNNKALPLFITVTCEFTRFDNPLRNTAGESIFLRKNGGVASLITTTREIFLFVGQRINQDLINALLDSKNENKSIAQILKELKNKEYSLQKFFVYYIGDPAMKLAIPKPNIKITKINGIDIAKRMDTLKALSKITFEGVVTDNKDVTLNNFNGILSTTIFDKPIDKTTLDNGNHGKKMKFSSQESKLFKGKSSISNGKFKFSFVVPKDIKISYGKGKLSFYATDKKTDKAGSKLDIIVGGINTNAPKDDKGPEIKAFINDESFVDGGNTNSSPNLILKLFDDNGINTSLTAIDHDIVAILDGNQSAPIVLNDFYQTELNDYTRGNITYPLRDLSVGKHTLKIKAWDTYNNSSEVTLNFTVVSGAELNLDRVLNYPNPFVNYTEFWFNHNKPNEPLQVQIQIFTISGKIVKTIDKNIQTTGNLSRTISWDGLDDFGNKIAKGVYVYKLSVKSLVSNLSAYKYEKLVIL